MRMNRKWSVEVVTVMVVVKVIVMVQSYCRVEIWVIGHHKSLILG